MVRHTMMISLSNTKRQRILQELAALKGSKYIQSNANYVYQNVRDSFI